MAESVPHARIIVMAKAPRPGLAKTRLAAALGADGAARLAERMLRHAVAEALRAGIGPVELRVTPDATHAAFDALVREHGIALAHQGEGDLGERMSRALAQALTQAPAAIVIGTDAPALDAAVLRAAAQALATHDAVLVPALDGGFVLLGLKRCPPGLLSGLRWSHAQVLQDTHARLRAAGLQVAQLPALADIDTPDDLQHLPAAWLDPHDRAAMRHELQTGLRQALREQRRPEAEAAFEALPDMGLAHLHLRLVGSGALARIPKQSQLGLEPQAHLDYEAACFERAQPCAHTPRLRAVLVPMPGLPRGALLVDEIVGRSARLPQDLDALVDALASLHTLPLPQGAPARAPLRDPADALEALRREVDAQALHLDAARLDPDARARIDAERAAFARLCAQGARPRRTLIAFDGHPGNFIVDAAGRAWLVDLEKARYGHPALDLAHATLYTSTTWDRASHAVLASADLRAACERWAAQVRADDAERRWIVPLRRAMWLWSVTWCAKWRALSAQAPQARDGGGEDWSAALSEDALVAHVRERVDHYLSAPVVQRVCDEADELARALR